MLKKRNVFVSILYTFLTCGVYGYFWIAAISNDISVYLDEERKGGMDAFLALITCGLYLIYWNFQQGKRIAVAQERAGLRTSDNSVLYLVISFFGLMMVPTWILQTNMNEIIDISN